MLDAYAEIETYDGGYNVTRLRRELYDLLASQGEAATATEEIQDLLAEKQEELREPTNWDQILGTKTAFELQLSLARVKANAGLQAEAISLMRAWIDTGYELARLSQYAMARLWMASWLVQLNEPLEALQQLRRVLSEVPRPSTNEDSLHGELEGIWFAAQMNLARIYEASGDGDQEEQAWKDLLSECKAVGGEAREDAMFAMQRVGAFAFMRRDYAEALSIYISLREIASRTLDPDDPRMLSVRWNVADCHSLVGNYAVARADLHSLIADHARIYGPDHPGAIRYIEQLEYLDRRQGTE